MQQQFYLDWNYTIIGVSEEISLSLTERYLFNYVESESPILTIESALKKYGFSSFSCTLKHNYKDKRSICSIMRNGDDAPYPLTGWFTFPFKSDYEEKLLKKDLEFQNFVYKVSHNIQGPIKSMKGLVSLAEMEDDVETLKNYFESFSKLTNKLDQLIYRLIEIVNVKAGLKGALQEIDIDQLIFDVLNTLHENSDISSIFFSIENNAKNSFYNQHFLVKQIFNHLISNAVEAFKGQDGYEIKISVSTDQNGNLNAEISNNGPAIPDYIEEHIFDMFYKGDKQGNHQGLGLYLVRTILEMLDGKISLQNEEGLVNFKLYIPNQYHNTENKNHRTKTENYHANIIEK